MIIKNEYPILEYSTDKIAVINPDRNASKPDRDGQGEGGFRRFPRLCLVTFLCVERGRPVEITATDD